MNQNQNSSFKDLLKKRNIREKFLEQSGDNSDAVIVSPSMSDIFNLDLSFQRPPQIAWEVLRITATSPPLLVTFVKKSYSDKENKDVGPSSCEPEEERNHLIYCRRLAQALHASIQTFCPEPMCILSLALDLEEMDVKGKIKEALANASKVLPLSRRLMTRAKCEDILKAIRTRAALSAFLPTLGKNASVDSVETVGFYEDSKYAIIETFSRLGGEILSMDKHMKPRLHLLTKTAESSTLSQSESIDACLQPIQSVLRICGPTANRKVGTKCALYEELDRPTITMLTEYNEFLFTELDALQKMECFFSAVRHKEIKAWVLLDDADDFKMDKLQLFLSHPSERDSSGSRSLSEASSKPCWQDTIAKIAPHRAGLWKKFMAWVG